MMTLAVSKHVLWSTRSMLLLLLTIVTGCVPYPVHKMLQPESTAIILDENDSPVESAQVSLVTSSYPYGMAIGLELKLTDGQGVVKFDADHEWRTEMLMVHGSEVFFWNWCIYKSGYETYLTNYRSADEWQDVFTVSLTPGIASECPLKQP
ncbi:MAG: hypothetical protein KTR27_00320 [Leptolyngbyaceae cyanobacterium MAG.088]|nr:hypothetical protein [Leptolyngbyaceae cyanobacterium MAG.088]